MINKILLLFSLLAAGLINAQEIGLNFNHNAEFIDFDYIEKTNVEWIRTTPRILDYYNGKLDISNCEALSKTKEAGVRGYKIAFGFRWDFKENKMRIPAIGSKQESELFELERKILEKVGPHIDIFKLGNEINLETMPVDMIPNENGEIPLVMFMQRQLEMVVIPYFNEKQNLNFPKIYIGSFPQLFSEKQQKVPAVLDLIKMANNDDRITGLSVHLHITNFTQAVKAFKFVRNIMPKKPIIVPEYSYHNLFLAHRTDLIGDTEEGKEFSKLYKRDPKKKVYEWCGIANSKGVSTEEWSAFFQSRSWFPNNFLLGYYDLYKKFGVVLATYPLFQQSCPKNMKPDSPMWFINPIFLQKSLIKNEDGSIAKNPLVYDDFIKIVQLGKTKK